PSPSWPVSFNPQHQTVPSLLRTQVCQPPAETSTTLAPSAVTWTGKGLSTLVPSPSWPKSFAPQHQSVPPSRRAHVRANPADTSATQPGQGVAPPAPPAPPVGTTGVHAIAVSTPRRPSIVERCRMTLALLAPFEPDPPATRGARRGSSIAPSLP